MTLKKLLLGSAAVFATGGVAQAADFIVPVVEPVDYVTYCDTTAGQGVAFAPTVCIRLGGRVQFTLNFGTWYTDGTSAPITSATAQSQAGYWNFTTDARVDVRASRETDYGWLESFIRITATSNNDSTDRDATINEMWLRYGWLQAGWFSSLYALKANAGYVGGATVDQFKLAWEAGNNTWSFAFEDPRDRARAAGGNIATMAFPDLVAQLDGEAGIFEYRFAAGYGARAVNNVYGVLGNIEVALGGGLEARLGGAVGWNGFDFVSNTSFLYNQNVGTGTYWAVSAGLNKVWNPMWTSNVEYTRADGPVGINGEQRVRFATTYQPLGNNQFQIQKQIDFEQQQVGDTYATQPWAISGFLRLIRNY